MRRLLAALSFLCLLSNAQAQLYVPSPDTSQFVNAAQAAAAAPVQSVNTQQGTVNVPTVCRQQSTALALPTSNPAAVTWTFPNTNCSFSAVPYCWSDISTTASTNAFDYPLNTARSTLAVTYSYSSHSNGLTISLGALTVTLGPPAGSTVILTCIGAPV